MGNGIWVLGACLLIAFVVWRKRSPASSRGETAKPISSGSKSKPVDLKALAARYELMSSSSKSKQVQGVLVLTRQRLSNSQTLLQQIVDQQRLKGYSIAPNFIATAGVTQDLNDHVYLYSTVRTEFSRFGGDDLMKRTIAFPFQADDGNSGNYYIVFDRP